jgi:hypothetical protein
LGPISNPATASERNYSVAQAARRKDIERAFGALKIKFNILNRPSLTSDITIMNRILRVCTILHNMVRRQADIHLLMCIFICRVQIVDEKRLARDGSETSVADAVEFDAQEADQDMTMPSELCSVEKQFLASARYLAFLNDAESHSLLRKDVSMHLWKHMKLDVANAKLLNYRGLIDE